MRKYNLNIAGYKIRFENPSNETEIIPSQRFSKYISTENKYDFLIRIQSGKMILPDSAVKVFDAPYVEEINDIRIKKSDEFWSVFQYHDDLFITVTFPDQDEERSAVLKFSLHSREWELRINNPGKSFDPMEYPLDGLILYYLTVIHGDIMIHASGINNAGHGYLFSGVSGKGKTTIAKLWDNTGARVIHDDRLIIRHTGSGGFVMHNTPVYRNDIPLQSPLNKIFLIEHGKKNELIPVRGAESISLVMANCIQHNWNSEIIARLLGSVSIMCSVIPVFRLLFKPDRSVIDSILDNE